MSKSYEAYCDECHDYVETGDVTKILAFDKEHQDCLLRDEPYPLPGPDGIATENLREMNRRLCDNVFTGS